MDLKRLVSECIQDKTTDLLLDDLGLVEVPDLHELYWVEKLDLSKNHIIKVSIFQEKYSLTLSYSKSGREKHQIGAENR